MQPRLPQVVVQPTRKEARTSPQHRVSSSGTRPREGGTENWRIKDKCSPGRRLQGDHRGCRRRASGPPGLHVPRTGSRDCAKMNPRVLCSCSAQGWTEEGGPNHSLPEPEKLGLPSDCSPFEWRLYVETPRTSPEGKPEGPPPVRLGCSSFISVQL